ncbi:hypothetical protein LOK74_19650 [Brevibacillus humidisoli]|uniref:hypothetical protein n=1 Tax=Brevibacillus humidisoli TaxID=2895522 RepID=UPI001E614E7A|nr:hypothetical protein [Brevibacillus humidisoli]UFJ40225.1 hypothetical protein LOK74_19650 [Brevibacillus humidisoli]
MYTAKQKQASSQGKRTVKWVVLALVILCSFLVGFWSGNADPASPVMERSDLEWAQEQGYLKAGIESEKQITQAEFLNGVMKRYGEWQTGLTVPKGAENHWAADVYALAKGKGVIDCSCQIKPDEPITTDEAVKFVMLAINTKANKQLTNFEEVQSWIKQDGEALVTYQDAATLIRKMDELYRYHKLIPQEENAS